MILSRKKIYMDRMIANDQKTDKLRMNARITTVFFSLSIFNCFSTGRQKILWNVFFFHQHQNENSTFLYSIDYLLLWWWLDG